MQNVVTRPGPSPHLHRFSDYLRSDRGFWLFFTWVAGMFSLLKALHLPNQWAATQVQVDYTHGVIKRGLFGEVCRLLHLPIYTSHGFAVVSLLLMALFLVALVRWVRTSGLLDTVGQGEAVCLFFGSYTFVYIVYLVGYLDIVLLTGAILTLGLRNSRHRIVMAVAWSIVAAFIHEMYVIAFLPLTVLPILLESADTSRRQRLRAWLLVAVSVAIPWAIVLSLALHAPLTHQAARQLYESASKRASFPLDETFFVVLSNSSEDNARYMHSILRVPRWWMSLAFDLLCFGPSSAFFLYLVWRMRERWAKSSMKTPVTAVVFISALSPLLLNLAGLDSHRWSALAGMNCFLAACIVSFHMPGGHMPGAHMPGAKRRIHLGTLSRKFIIVVLFLSAGTDYGLFYGQLKPFPFVQYADSLYDACRALLHKR
jgi:hypothetical protein